MQQVAQRCWGEPALVPVGHRGQKGEAMAEEPGRVDLRRLLRRRIYTDVYVRDQVRWRSDHISGRGREEAAPPSRPWHRVGVYHPHNSPLLGTSGGPALLPWSPAPACILLTAVLPPDVRQEDHDPPLLGGAHLGGHVGLVGLLSTFGDPHHNHARRRGSRIHRGGGGECGRRDWKKMRKNAEKKRKMREKIWHKMRFC